MTVTNDCSGEVRNVSACSLGRQYPSIVDFTSTSYTVTSASNSDTVLGDVAMQFATPLSNGVDDVSGTFNVQNDFAPYTLVGTISGKLVPLAPAVPEAATSVLMLLCLVVLAGWQGLGRC